MCCCRIESFSAHRSAHSNQTKPHSSELSGGLPAPGVAQGYVGTESRPTDAELHERLTKVADSLKLESQVAW